MGPRKDGPLQFIHGLRGDLQVAFATYWAHKNSFLPANAQDAGPQRRSKFCGNQLAPFFYGEHNMDHILRAGMGAVPCLRRSGRHKTIRPTTENDRLRVSSPYSFTCAKGIWENNCKSTIIERR